MRWGAVSLRGTCSTNMVVLATWSAVTPGTTHAKFKEGMSGIQTLCLPGAAPSPNRLDQRLALQWQLVTFTARLSCTGPCWSRFILSAHTTEAPLPALAPMPSQRASIFNQDHVWCSLIYCHNRPRPNCNCLDRDRTCHLVNTIAQFHSVA